MKRRRKKNIRFHALRAAPWRSQKQHKCAVIVKCFNSHPQSCCWRIRMQFLSFFSVLPCLIIISPFIMSRNRRLVDAVRLQLCTLVFRVGEFVLFCIVGRKLRNKWNERKKERRRDEMYCYICRYMLTSQDEFSGCLFCVPSLAPIVCVVL